MKDKRQEIIDKLEERTRKDILKKLKQEFIAEDEKEPFRNRGYVKDTLQVFHMLIEGDEDDFITIQGSALCDVVSDIFRYYGEEY